MQNELWGKHKEEGARRGETLFAHFPLLLTLGTMGRRRRRTQFAFQVREAKFQKLIPKFARD